MKKLTFQLQDLDGESMGLLQTEMSSSIIQKEWTAYINSETDDMGIEEFITQMKAKYPKFIFKRFFIDKEISA